MMTTDNSRADALTPCVHADDPKACYRVRCQLGAKCLDDDMSPRQPAAAPIETCPVCHAKPGQWQCPKSTNNLYNAPPDAACRAAPAPSPADERVGLTAEQRESVDHAATWLDRSEDLQNKAHAERLRALLQGANHAG
ncbi:hypothetical protein [Burkholderia vietnamiensis]|jgi:hypothetical protein|uniref:hypothetical protein n=1 Tax=Burkholderia vietnamiensis TaxID=60552 RepID=UPI001041AD49|nr:hypothetical protein [Burkholderia vietnamiensis]